MRQFVDKSGIVAVVGACAAGVYSTVGAWARISLQFLAWDMSMTVAGAVICYVLFG